MTEDSHFLCNIDDIPLNNSKGFIVDSFSLFAIRTLDAIYVYRNQCPHLGVALEWQEHQFLNHDQSLIQCSTHGALFSIESGHCIYGPCQGRHLASVAVYVNNDAVYICMDTTNNASP
jgi:nitrite reductase/ring-hydroxylating ferredoxin subunit